MASGKYFGNLSVFGTFFWYTLIYILLKYLLFFLKCEMHVVLSAYVGANLNTDLPCLSNCNSGVRCCCWLNLFPESDHSLKPSHKAIVQL